MDTQHLDQRLRPSAAATTVRLEARPARRVATVDIVVPVYDEEATLARSIRRLHRYLTAEFPIPWVITIADNASTDRTWGIACQLVAELDGVAAVHLDRKGRGRALKAAWAESPAPVVAYMDVDLSTSLDALLPLVAPLVSGHSDVAIGTRLARGSRVVRGPKREAISRSYNLLLRTALRSGFSDAQCGFKAVRADAAAALLPLVEDDGWFFDTELLVLAETNGYRVHEVPVDWVDDPDSRVDIVATATEDLRGIWRMLRNGAQGRLAVREQVARRLDTQDDSLGGQLVRFASIGAVSTMVFAALVAVLRGPLGLLGADLAALATCAVANTAANRRLTFDLRGRADRGRHLAGAALVTSLPLGLNLLAVAGLSAAGVSGIVPILATLTVANGIATLARFLLLRNWVFRPAGGAS